MAFEDLAGVLMIKRGCCSAGNFVEEIDSNREICSIDEACTVLFDECVYAIGVVVPACGSHDHIFAAVNAGFDMGENAMRCGEVDDGIDCTELLWTEGRAILILAGSDDVGAVSVLSGNF